MTITSSNLDQSPGPQPLEEYSDPPVWLQRLFTFVYALFCMALGLLLVRLPWSEGWFEDGLIAGWPAAQHVLHHGFVRGAVSGLGLIDIWIGILEVVRFSTRRPAAVIPNDSNRVSHDQQQQ